MHSFGKKGLMSGIFLICVLVSGLFLTSGTARAAAGDGVLGKFDAQHLDDASLPARVWRSHSTVDPSSIASTSWLVSTNIAMSDNNGATFTDLGVVNAGFDVASSTISWLNEVSALFFDPSAESASRSKIVWHRYMVDNGQPNWANSWIAMKTASVPIGPWSSEVKLLAGSLYNPNDPLNPDPKIPLFSLPPNMADCLVLTEPGILYVSSGFYMSTLCRVANLGQSRIPLVKFSHPTPTTTTLAYKGNLLGANDAALFANRYGTQYPELANTYYFDGTSMFTKSNVTYLLASPVDSTGKYLGCALFKITNIETASIQRSGGKPTMLKYIPGIAGTHRGACTYTTKSTGSGVVISQISTTGQPFTLVNTGVQLP